MADNPVDNKAVDVLAAAAGVPTPAQARRTWAAVWRYRKLALILGGVGLAAAGGGYGYKYIKATPSTANAEPPAVTAPKPEDPKPGPPAKDDTTFALPPVKPATPADPLPDVPAIPLISPPADIKVPAPMADKTDTPPAPILPPLITPPAVKRPTGGDDDGPAIEPPIPEIKLPATDKKKPAADDPDGFKATGPVPTDKKPAALPTDVTDKKDRPKPDAPVLRVQGTDTPKVEVPATDKVEVPATPKVEVPVKTDDPAIPMIPKIDIDTPPPGPAKVGDPAKDDIPTITIPMVRPGPKPDVPPVTIDPMTDLPPLPTGDPVVKPPVSADPPAVNVPTIDVKLGPAPGAAAPDKRDTYNEDWHTWKDGDTMALISQEYYHDAKYAAALDAYNKNRKRGDYVRVPDLWKLEELFPNLIKGDKADKADRPEPSDRPRPPEARPTGNAGIKFEPVAPLSSSGRAAPPPATSRARDEYRVAREAGETIREVAQKALGDGNAWKKLYELNPGIDPTLPLPAGTIVRLPR
jgi:hypothetical protein